MKFKLLAFLFLFFVTTTVSAQEPGASGVALPDIISRESSGTFKAALPALQAIPGGRAPFYTYLWDFGDGHFSTEAEPLHRYAQEGDYEVLLYATNNYDFGPRPPRPKKPVKINNTMLVGVEKGATAEQHFFTSNGVFQLSKNANALPGQDMVIVAGVKPGKGKGKIFLLTNEKMYGKPGFLYRGQSNYYGERVIPEDSLILKTLWASAHKVTITQSGSPDYGNREDRNLSPAEAVQYFSGLYNSYKTVTAYEIKERTDTAQFCFINLDIAPDMLKDTNAMVTITGIYLPENGEAVVHQLEVPIVASHDPNKMSLKQARLSYRTMNRKKELKYKVQFQNDGEGDVKNIRLEIGLPGNIDTGSFQLLNLYPKCVPCSQEITSGCWKQYTKGKDTLVFLFKDISLPGTKAADILDKDSTKGFVKFTVNPRRRLPNKPFRGKTQIFFDKNDPITTNSATGRFRKGFSPIVFAGIHTVLKDADAVAGITNVDNRNGWLAGIGVAPIAPYRKPYWQVELYVNTWEQSSVAHVQDRGEIKIKDRYYGYFQYDRMFAERYVQLRIVPLQVRYNINRFLSVGLGLMAKLDFNLSEKENLVYHLLNNGKDTLLSDPIKVIDGKNNERNFRVQPFTDINLGKVTLGPSLGLRYIYDGRKGQFLNLYGAWRF